MVKLERSDGNAAFDGPLLWVHHDVNNRTALPHRRRIFSHIQGYYRPWKRREHNKSLQKISVSVKRPEDEQIDDRPESPQTILAQGNSDPFTVYAVKIGPAENELVSFYRDFFLPAQYGMRLKIPKLDHLQARDWADCISGLTDEGIAHGLLARWGQMVGRCTPKVRKAALEHQNRSIELLRRKVARGQQLRTFDDYMHLNHLFSAETISGNLYGAHAHGRMLKSMFDQAWKQGTLDYKLLIWEFHNDIQTGVMFLVRPVFDVDTFLPRLFAPLKAKAERASPAMHAADDELDPAIEGSLVELFSEIQRFWQAMAIRESLGNTDLASTETMSYNALQELLLLGRFVAHYVNIKEWIEQGVTEELRQQLIVQRSIALAAIYLVKSLNHNPTVLGVPMFDAAPSVLSALRTSIEESDRILDETYQCKFSNAKLWALYVGALAEQGFPISGVDASGQWFSTSLAEQALAMGLHSWGEVKGVLLRFLHNDRIPPNGALWFEKTLVHFWEHSRDETGSECEGYHETLLHVKRDN